MLKLLTIHKEQKFKAKKIGGGGQFNPNLKASRVNCQGNLKFIQRVYIFIHKKYNHSRQLYSFTESYSFQGTFQFIKGNTSSFKEDIFFHGNYIHSRKYKYSLRNIYSLKFKAMCSLKLYPLNIVASAEIAEIFIQKYSPATL